MREDPAIEIWRNLTIVDHVAAVRVIVAYWSRGFDDLVIGDDVWDFVATRHLGPGNVGPGAISPDNKPGGHDDFFATGLVTIGDMGAIGVPVDAQERTNAPFGPGHLRPSPKEIIKMFSVDHSDKAVFDGYIHATPGG